MNDTTHTQNVIDSSVGLSTLLAFPYLSLPIPIESIDAGFSVLGGEEGFYEQMFTFQQYYVYLWLE